MMMAIVAYLAKLETIDTDITGAKPARLGDSVYVVDGSANKLITDTYGYAPDFEFQIVGKVVPIRQRCMRLKPLRMVMR